LRMLYNIDMNLVKELDPILRKKVSLWNFEDPSMDPKELVKELQDARRAGPGVGLAAPQVGLDTSVIVIGMGNLQTEGVEDFSSAYFNPKITEFGEETMYMIEGCLSFPDLFVKVKRPTDIVLKYYDVDGTKYEERFVGMTSRIIQHEVDHLDGITFIQRANRHHLQTAQKNRKLLQRRRKNIDQAE